LAVKGYRIISVQYPPFDTFADLCQGLESFLDFLGVSSVHLFGSGLGGYIALCYVTQYQKRVRSIILCNSYCRLHGDTMTGISWVPAFFLKQKLLGKLPDYELESKVADSVDFMVAQIESLSQEEIASRLILEASPNFFDIHQMFPFDQSKVTLIDAVDNNCSSDTIRDELNLFFPLAHQALLKSGGPFPYISRPDEVNLYIEVHCRRLKNESLQLDEQPSVQPSPDKLSVNVHSEIHAQRKIDESDDSD